LKEQRKVWVRQVDPVGINGFKQGEIALRELQPGLNLVLAKNATGKSTLAKSIGLLFDPAKFERDKQQIVLGILDGHDGERHVQAKRKGGRYPGFPGEADQYQLDLLKLVEGFKSDQSPLDAEIGDGMRFTPAPPVGMQRIGEVSNAKDARQRLIDARREKALIAETEDNLPRLQALVDEAEFAKVALDTLRAFEAKLTTETRLATLQKDLAETAKAHPGIERQKEDAATVGKTLLEGLARSLNSFGDAETKLKNAHPDGQRPKKPLSLKDRSALESVAAELSSLEAQIASAQRDHQSELAKAAAARDQAFHLLPTEDHSDLPSATAQDFEKLIAIAGQADAARVSGLQAEAFQNMLRDWQQDSAPHDPDLDKKIQRIFAWLTQPILPATPRLIPIFVGIALAFIVVAATPILAARIAFAILAIAIAAFALLKKPTQAERPDITDLTKGSEPIAVWESLTTQKARLEIEKQLEAKSKIPPTTVDWQGLASELRLKCQNPYSLAPLATSLSLYHQASVAAEASKARLESLTKDATTKQNTLKKLFQTFDYPVNEGQELHAVEAFKSWFNYTLELEKAEQNALAAETSLKEFLKENGIAETKDPEKALALLNQRVQFAQKYRAAGQEAETMRLSLENYALDEAQLKEILPNPTELTSQKRKYEALAVELPDRRQALSDARSKVQAAEKASIPDREHEYETALSKVEVKFDQLVRQAVRARLGKEIQERLRTTELPEVVKRASGYLESFTQGRFRLEIGAERTDGLGMLVVRDQFRQVQSFDQLSTGTKVHAVIAIRLAVITSQEEKAGEHSGAVTRFPLIADEALAVSDPECAAEIAATLASIARERQVIVFTSQPLDVPLFLRFEKRANVIQLDRAEPQVEETPTPRRTRKEVVTSSAVSMVQLGLDI
jgi:energy-coupling factor transporter ATP-binding protein EcfA2